jgi:2-polyprenyl-3-methyl-5-hydroxy-6-metoxy-1,4-benzoquinol methylase
MTDPKIARQYFVEDNLAQGVPLLERHWYYSIEVEPGIFTNGRQLKNIALTRAALRHIDVANLECLDIGCTECLIPILLARRGAKRIVAYDRLNLSERVNWLSSQLNVNFQYLCEFPLSELSRCLPDNQALFDLVVFSGVLYHMFDPFAGLLIARSFLRNGGIMLLETAAVISEENCSYFNAGGRLYPPNSNNYWLVSVKCLDYLLRLLRLKPLDCYYLRQGSPRSDLQLCRICIPCLAVDSPVATSEDQWIHLNRDKDFQEYLDWKKLASASRPPLSYPDTHADDHPLVYYGDRAVDVMESVKLQDPLPVTDSLNQISLKLDAIY